MLENNNRLTHVQLDTNLCKSFSKAAIDKATAAHNREKNMSDYLNMYKEII